jgi:RNA polymerase sigma-70 factor (ECF subfamily)
MNDHAPEPRLSQINTNWSMIRQAHHSQGDEAHEAQRLLLQRYGGAVFCYVRGIVHDTDAADDLFQEFAVRFLRGDFRAVKPQSGRFRDFVKTVLRHMVIDYHRDRQQAHPAGSETLVGMCAAEPCADTDARFLAAWRNELLSRAWDRLAEVANHSNQPLYEALRFRAEHAGMRSAELATYLGVRLGKPLTAAGFRQVLHRARALFADFLLDEVAASLADPSLEQLQEELIDLGLLPYCEPALARRAAGH